ncbi:MAG: porin [Gammaproteobacteria bacterium]|nr:porin [Gammaproteobacteria bacterium]
MNIQKVLLVSAIAMPMSAGAVEVAGEKLEVYGKVHVSIDSVDRDDPAVSNDGMSISSNSSRLGFKGKLATESDIDIIWQLEQEVSVDDSNKGNFADRNTFIGLASGKHSIRAGVHDTPFKSVASKWGIFGDSVGERRSILGASANKGNQLNERVKNMLMYQFADKSVKLQAMYAVDPEDTGDTAGKADDTDYKMMGLGLWYKLGNLKLSAGWEDWDQHSVIEDGSAYRIAASYKMDAHQLGLIYEDIDSDGLTDNALAFNRSAYGVNWKWKFASKTDLRVQYLVADDADESSDTGATKLGFGIFHQLDKKAKVYFAYGATDNDDNAKYQAVDGGHGDEVKTVAGGSPNAISAGIEFKF